MVAQGGFLLVEPLKLALGFGFGFGLALGLLLGFFGLLGPLGFFGGDALGFSLGGQRQRLPALLFGGDVGLAGLREGFFDVRRRDGEEVVVASFVGSHVCRQAIEFG